MILIITLCLYRKKHISGWWFNNPSEKYELVSWDDDIPKIWKVIKVMFQTTKQILNINVKGFGFSATPAFAMHVLESPKCVFTVEIIQLAHGLHTFWGKHGKRHQCHHGFGVIICYHHDHPP